MDNEKKKHLEAEIRKILFGREFTEYLDLRIRKRIDELFKGKNKKRYFPKG